MEEKSAVTLNLNGVLESVIGRKIIDLAKDFVGEVVSATFSYSGCLESTNKLASYVGVIVSLLPLNSVEVRIDHDAIVDECQCDEEYMLEVSIYCMHFVLGLF